VVIQNSYLAFNRQKLQSLRCLTSRGFQWREVIAEPMASKPGVGWRGT